MPHETPKIIHVFRDKSRGNPGSIIERLVRHGDGHHHQVIDRHHSVRGNDDDIGVQFFGPGPFDHASHEFLDAGRREHAADSNDTDVLVHALRGAGCCRQPAYYFAHFRPYLLAVVVDASELVLA